MASPTKYYLGITEGTKEGRQKWEKDQWSYELYMQINRSGMGLKVEKKRNPVHWNYGEVRKWMIKRTTIHYGTSIQGSREAACGEWALSTTIAVACVGRFPLLTPFHCTTISQFTPQTHLHSIHWCSTHLPSHFSSHHSGPWLGLNVVTG